MNSRVEEVSSVDTRHSFFLLSVGCGFISIFCIVPAKVASVHSISLCIVDISQVDPIKFMDLFNGYKQVLPLNLQSYSQVASVP